MNSLHKSIQKLKSLGDSFKTGIGRGSAVGAGLATPGGTMSTTANMVTDTAAAGVDKLTGAKKSACTECGTADCACTSKALKSTDLAIPFYMRRQHDPSDIERSATQQTSRMYTSLAQPVRETLQQKAEDETRDPRINVAKSMQERADQIQQLRKSLAEKAMQTRTDPRFR